MEKRYELRAAASELSTKGRTVQGYAVVYDALADLGEFFETVKQGALQHVAARDVRALYHHDDMQLLGTTRAGTLSLVADNKGLFFELELPNTSYGNDVLELIKRGDVSGCSFGFIAARENWLEGGKPTRELLEVDLHEITLTATPAYPDTSLALRTMPKSNNALSNAKRWLETC